MLKLTFENDKTLSKKVFEIDTLEYMMEFIDSNEKVIIYFDFANYFKARFNMYIC